MMKRIVSHHLWALLCLICCNMSATIKAQEVHKTYFVPKPGTLISLMTEEEANSITHLTLSGKINATDIKHLRDEFENLQVLNLAAVDIKMYTGKEGTFNGQMYVYMPNNIPPYAFCQQNDSVVKGKTSLKKIVLSDKIKAIEDFAFKGCTNLKVCQILRKKAPGLMKEALADSITAIFIPRGSTDDYQAKTRWSNFSLIEGNDHSVNLNIGELSSLEAEMQKAGIQPWEVNFLILKGKLDDKDFKLIRDYMPNLVGIDMRETTTVRIPDFTFSQKKYLLNVLLPNGLKSIGQRAFSSCKRLCGTLILPESMTALGDGAFMDCVNLRAVVAKGKGITAVGENLFGDNNNRLILP